MSGENTDSGRQALAEQLAAAGIVDQEVILRNLLRQAMLSELQNDEYKTPDVIFPPFRDQAWQVVDKMPAAVVITDTHLMPPLGANEPYEAFSSTKRRAFGLGRIPTLRNLTRRNDAITRIAMHAARHTISAELADADVFYHAGDVSDSYSLRGFLHTMAYVEQYVANRYSQSDRGGRRGYFTVATGNHDVAFRGPDTWAGYHGISLPQIENETFTAMVSYAKSGRSMNGLNMAMKQAEVIADKRSERKLHPAQRWFLQRIYTGPEIGAYEKVQDDNSSTIVAFLNSEFSRPGCTLSDLRIALQSDLNLHPAEQVATDMISTYESDIERQEQIMQGIFSRLTGQQESKAVVYAHNPNAMQDELIQYYCRSFATEDKSGAALLAAATAFVQERFTVYGGHFHTGDIDTGEKRKGTRRIRGFTRVFAGALAQVPAYTHTGSLTFRPFEYDTQDYAEVLAGPLDNPRQIKITTEQIQAEMRRLGLPPLKFGLLQIAESLLQQGKKLLPRKQLEVIPVVAGEGD